MMAYLVIGALGLFLINTLMKIRRERKHNQLRDMQRELRNHLKGGDKREHASRERNDDRRITQLEVALKRAEEESRSLAVALEALRTANEAPTFRSPRTGARKTPKTAEPTVQQQSTLLPAVMRSGRTGARLNLH